MTHSILSRFLSYSLVFVLLLVVLTGSMSAQTVTNRSTDGPTPAGVSPGAAAGTYALSGFDNINFATGSLNFRLPLRTIGGRGTAQYTMMLPIERHWSVKGQGHYYSCGGSQICFHRLVSNRFWVRSKRTLNGGSQLGAFRQGMVI